MYALVFFLITVLIQGSVASRSLACHKRFLSTVVNKLYSSPSAHHYGTLTVYVSAIRDHVGLQPYTNNLNFRGSGDVVEDPCWSAPNGFTYGMSVYGCRSYWICMNSHSVRSCCAAGTRYVQGMGCLRGLDCNDPCPLIR